MSDTPKANPISPTTKLYVNGEEPMTMAEYTAANVRKFPKLNEGQVKKISMHVKSNVDYDTDEIEDSKVKKQADAFMAQAKVDFKAHKANKAKVETAAEAAKAEAAAAREADKKAKDDDKNESIALMDKGLDDTKLVKATTQLTESADKTIGSVLGKSFTLASSGEIQISGDPDKKAFAATFSGLVGINKTSEVIADRSAKVEAQIAFAAKETLGDSWPNLFSNREKDLSRVKTNLAAFGACKVTKAGMRVFLGLPISTTRALTQLKVTNAEEAGSVDKAIADNTAAKNEVLKRAAALLKEREAAGGTVTQTEAKNIVSEYKKELGLGGKTRFKYFYIAIVGQSLKVFGTEALDEAALAVSAECIDYNGNRIQLVKGEAKTEPLEGPTGEVAAKIAEYMKEAQEAAEKDKDKGTGKKGKADKADKSKPAADEQDDDDDEEEVKPAKNSKKAAVVEEDEDDDDDDERDNAPAKPEKNAAKKVVAEEEEDDDDDEDEDEDEDEDDDE